MKYLIASLTMLTAAQTAGFAQHMVMDGNVYLRMMDTMMMKMDQAPKGRSAAEDFVLQMIPHHEGAVSMALYEIQHGHDFEIQQLAKSILAEQQVELQQMRLWLQHAPVGDDAATMTAWAAAMGGAMDAMMRCLPTNPKTQPTDLAFALTMKPHHQAAIDMARAVMRYGKDSLVTGFAKRLISDEQIEIEQMADYANDYAHDRVYTSNQVSNSISVVDPAHNIFLGEILLGRPYPGVLNPLYKGQSLVHGLRYLPERKLLAAVAIGSNSVTLISTETNTILKTIYVGRSPHEPTFTPDGKQIWVSVRGEAYISVIDLDRQEEVKRVAVPDGPGMVSFSPDGKTAWVCSSFTPEVTFVNTGDYSIVKHIPVTSPFSPNIFTSPKGEWVALTHKDVGKVTVINTRTMAVEKVLNTGPITNHVTFCYVNGKLLMPVTVGGENRVRFFEPEQDFKEDASVPVGAVPHGVWPSADGKLLYVGLEFGDQVQGIDLQTMRALPAVKIGQSPQALVYADHAVTDPGNSANLHPLNDSAATSVLVLNNTSSNGTARGRISVRPVGLVDLVEQLFTTLEPNASYTLGLTRSDKAPYAIDYTINAFITDASGKYAGQSTGLVRGAGGAGSAPYKHLVLISNSTKDAVLIDAGTAF